MIFSKRMIKWVLKIFKLKKKTFISYKNMRGKDGKQYYFIEINNEHIIAIL